MMCPGPVHADVPEDSVDALGRLRRAGRSEVRGALLLALFHLTALKLARDRARPGSPHRRNRRRPGARVVRIGRIAFLGRPRRRTCSVSVRAACAWFPWGTACRCGSTRSKSWSRRISLPGSCPPRSWQPPARPARARSIRWMRSQLSQRGTGRGSTSMLRTGERSRSRRRCGGTARHRACRLDRVRCPQVALCADRQRLHARPRREVPLALVQRAGCLRRAGARCRQPRRRSRVRGTPAEPRVHRPARLGGPAGARQRGVRAPHRTRHRADRVVSAR